MACVQSQSYCNSLFKQVNQKIIQVQLLTVGVLVSCINLYALAHCFSTLQVW